jgi:hypothetical protein
LTRYNDLLRGCAASPAIRGGGVYVRGLIALAQRCRFIVGCVKRRPSTLIGCVGAVVACISIAAGVDTPTSRATSSPTFVSNSGVTLTYSSVDRTAAVARPASVQTGDVLVADVFDSNATSVSAPAGWKRVVQRTSSASTTSHAAIYVKVAGSSEPSSYTFSNATPGGIWTALEVAISAYRGVDQSDPVNAAAFNETAQSGSGTTASSASVPVTVDGAMIHAFSAFKTYTSTASGPSGATVDFDNYWSTGTTHFAVSHDAMSSAGIAQRSFTSTGLYDPSLTAVVALKPANAARVPYATPVRLGAGAAQVQGSTSLPLAAPVSIAPNDVVVAVLYSAFGRTVTAPSGWSILDQSASKAVLVHRGGTTEPADGKYLFTVSGSTDYLSGVIAVYRNAAFPVEAHVLTSPASSTSTPTAATRVANGSNRMVVSWLSVPYTNSTVLRV